MGAAVDSRRADKNREECHAKNRPDLWDVFDLRVVRPALFGAEPADYGQLAERLSADSPRQVINLLATAKRMFERHLRQMVAAYASEDGAAIDREIDNLRDILGGARDADPDVSCD